LIDETVIKRTIALSLGARTQECRADRNDEMKVEKHTGPGAEDMAIAALGFIAADPALLPRFLAITGIEAQAIRTAAREPGFLAGVLQFIVAHEPTLMAFAENAGIEPTAVLKAMRALPQGDDRYEGST
jgi:hypothetical protein